MRTGKMQEVHAEQGAEQDNQALQAPIEARRVPLHGHAAGGEDGNGVETRHEAAEDRLRHGAALPGLARVRTGGRDAASVANVVLKLDRRRSLHHAILHLAFPRG